MGFFTESNNDGQSIRVTEAAQAPADRGFYMNFKLHQHVALETVVLMSLVLVGGIVLARATTLVARSPLGRQAISADPAASLVSLLLTLGVFAVAIVGFLSVPWYWPLAFLCLGFFASSVVVNQHNAAGLYGLTKPAGGLLVCVTAYILWRLLAHT